MKSPIIGPLGAYGVESSGEAFEDAVPTRPSNVMDSLQKGRTIVSISSSHHVGSRFQNKNLVAFHTLESCSTSSSALQACKHSTSALSFRFASILVQTQRKNFVNFQAHKRSTRIIASDSKHETKTFHRFKSLHTLNHSTRTYFMVV